MSKQSTCAGCGHDAFYVVETAESPNYEFSNSMEPLGLTGFYGPTGEQKASFFGGEKKARMVVQMSAEVCVRCRRITWYAKDTALLERMAREGNGVRVRRGNEP